MLCKGNIFFCFIQHIAATKGYEDITVFLIEKGVDINVSDKFGNTPLFEAIRNSHDQVASLLASAGASLTIDDAGDFLCMTVAKRKLDLLQRVLGYGINPNAKNYDHRTPLHVAASEGLYFAAKLLLEAGASVLSRDRYKFQIQCLQFANAFQRREDYYKKFLPQL